MTMKSESRSGPLAGLTVIELVGIGPGPFCGMMLSDMGARVVSVERPGAPDRTADVLLRGRESIALDLKNASAVEVLLRLCELADVFFEGHRPGVAERLGIGPEVCLERNPRLDYGRVTGWGQEGPLAHAAGHDIDFIALTGALHAIGVEGGKPVPPLNLVGDFGGGGMLLAFGIVCAVLEAQRSGRGQVVDAAMIDGAAAQMAQFYWLRQMGYFDGAPGTSVLGGAAPYYGVYETADGRFVALGAIEPGFYRLMVDALGLDPRRFAGKDFASGHRDRGDWQELRRELEKVFRTRTRDEWCELLEGTDVCLAPVLTLDEAPEHPHHRARGSYLESGGRVQQAPAPRFSRSRPRVQGEPRRAGEDGDRLLRELGYSEAEIDELRRRGAIP